MTQRPYVSLIEAATQSLVGLPIGFVVSFAVGLLGLSAAASAALITGTMFLASTLRGYLIRRGFQRWRGARFLVVCFLFVAGSAPAGQARTPRSHAELVKFARVHPCPSTGLRITSCRGYVIDHIVPLCAGGADKPSNMQWQEYRQSLVKDRWERRLCARLRRGSRAER